MKKALYGTTALATAGLVAGIAGGAAAQDHGGGRIQIEVHGYMQQWLVGVDQDFNDNGLDRLPTTRRFTVNQNNKAFNLDQKTNAEVCFVGQTTLDNGITVGVNVQLEAFREGAGQNWIDETFLFVQSDRFGQLKIGSEDGVGELLSVNAPDGGISVDAAGDVTTLQMFNPVSGVIDDTAVSTEASGLDGDSNKITYITPRFYGFQAGASFTPLNSDTSSNPQFGDFQNSGYAAALNYSNVFANGFGLQATGAIVGFNQTCGSGGPGGAGLPGNGNDSDGSCNGAMEWRAGAQMSYAGFTIGGGYKRTYGNDGSETNGVVVDTANSTLLPGSRNLNGASWSVGGTYETGPYTVGVTFVQGWGVGWNIPGTGDYNSSIGTIAGTYQLGPGIRLRGGFFLFDQDAEEVPDGQAGVASALANQAARNAGIQNTSSSSGWGGAVAITASF